MSVTLNQLRAAFPKINVAYVDPINETLNTYGMTTKTRIAAFLGQAGHECVYFMRFEENLNYSADGLHATFPRYFPTLASAVPYARNPQKIANYVYANRLGNGPPASNDGWTFRGRGAIQITGRANYTAFAESLHLTLGDALNFIQTPRGQVMSAGWFWNTNHLNAVADTGNFKELTRRINGGYIGLDDRTRLYNAMLHVL